MDQWQPLPIAAIDDVRAEFAGLLGRCEECDRAHAALAEAVHRLARRHGCDRADPLRAVEVLGAFMELRLRGGDE